MLSPGRVSPIDLDPATEPDQGPKLAIPSRSGSFRVPSERFSMIQLHAESFRAPTENPAAAPVDLPEPSRSGRCNAFDVRLNLMSKKAGEARLVLELNSDVLCSNSEVFADLVKKYRKGSSAGRLCSSLCQIEVPDVENVGVFRDTIELMFEDDISKSLMKVGVNRCIDILEVSPFGISFSKLQSSSCFV